MIVTYATYTLVMKKPLNGLVLLTFYVDDS